MTREEHHMRLAIEAAETARKALDRMAQHLGNCPPSMSSRARLAEATIITDQVASMNQRMRARADEIYEGWPEEGKGDG